jgi:hypothetical protein
LNQTCITSGCGVDLKKPGPLYCATRPSTCFLQVDLNDVVKVLAARGLPEESLAADAGIVKFLRKTFDHAGTHFRKGSPGNWRRDGLFDNTTRATFAHHYQCLLETFRCLILACKVLFVNLPGQRGFSTHNVGPSIKSLLFGHRLFCPAQ